MNVASIMKTRVVTIRPEERLSVAAQLMRRIDGRHLPVVIDEVLVGVVSERDLLKARVRRADEGDALLVRDVMSTPTHHVDADASVAGAAARMASERIGCLPVVREGRLVGLLTTTDVLAALEREDFTPREDDLVERGLRALEAVRHVRERLRVQAHLGRGEARERWRKLRTSIAKLLSRGS